MPCCSGCWQKVLAVKQQKAQSFRLSGNASSTWLLMHYQSLKLTVKVCSRTETLLTSINCDMTMEFSGQSLLTVWQNEQWQSVRMQPYRHKSAICNRVFRFQHTGRILCHQLGTSLLLTMKYPIINTLTMCYFSQCTEQVYKPATSHSGIQDCYNQYTRLVQNWHDLWTDRSAESHQCTESILHSVESQRTSMVKICLNSYLLRGKRT